jgi:hypothetical protein
MFMVLEDNGFGNTFLPIGYILCRFIIRFDGVDDVLFRLTNR